MRVRIHVVAGVARGRVVELADQGQIVVGRATDVDLSVAEDTALSRRHAVLELQQGTLVARDLQSRHGTFVNGYRVDARELAHGDHVQVGETVLAVELVRASAAPLLPAASPDAATMLSTPATAQRSIRCRCGLVFTGLAADGDDIVYYCPSCYEELAAAPVLPPGFSFVKLLGRGAMGSVSLVRDDATGQPYAIKQILPKAAMSAQMRAMFSREAVVQSQLDHPNIVRVFGLTEPLPGSFSIVMEYVEGRSAETLLDDGRIATPELAVAIGCQALDGLAYAHARQIVHRDVKEANLMLVERGGALVVKVADFGLAKNFQESGASGITTDGALGGTLAYMPREQLLDFKYVKPPADIYALGATLYRLLSGEYPRDYRDGDNWIRVSLEQPVIPLRQRPRGRDVPPKLSAVIEGALETDVSRRYQTAADMRRALAAAV